MKSNTAKQLLKSAGGFIGPEKPEVPKPNVDTPAQSLAKGKELTAGGSDIKEVTNKPAEPWYKSPWAYAGIPAAVGAGGLAAYMMSGKKKKKDEEKEAVCRLLKAASGLVH